VARTGEQLLVEMRNGRRFRWEVTQTDRTCQRCGAPICWVVTHHEKPMPVDEPEGDEELTTSHFDTCQWTARRT
jgi:hypothetical protein